MPHLIMLLFHLRVDVPFAKIDISSLYSIRHLLYNINTKYFSTQEDKKHHFPPKVSLIILLLLLQLFKY